MFKLLLVFALIVGLSVAGPVRRFQLRRLDPSAPEEIEDFEVSEDEDPESITIDAAEGDDGEFPDSPPPSMVDSSSEDEYSGSHLSQRQESRLERLSANYEQISAQESQIYAALHLSEANLAETQSNIKENEADARDLQRFSDWLADEAQAQYEFALELQGTPDASREEKLGDILDQMSEIAANAADLELQAVRKQERQAELEETIRRWQEEEAGQKGEQAELQLDQLYLEHDMIDNENRFKELDRELFHVADGEDYQEGDGYIGKDDENGKGEVAIEEAQDNMVADE